MAVSTHQGGCHCGAVRYSVEIDPEANAIACNCSMCGRSGTLLQFVPEGMFKLQQGDGNLSDYTFNKNVIHHLFCKTCGIKSFARGQSPRGEPIVAVNVRCLDGIDPFSVQTHNFDGASR